MPTRIKAIFAARKPESRLNSLDIIHRTHSFNTISSNLTGLGSACEFRVLRIDPQHRVEMPVNRWGFCFFVFVFVGGFLED